MKMGERRGCLKKQATFSKKGKNLSNIMSGIISCAQAKIQKELKEREAFDEISAADAEEAKINFKAILDLMERKWFNRENS